MKIIKEIEKFIENTMVSICTYPISVTLTMMFYMAFQYGFANGKLLWFYIGQIVLMFDKSGFEVAVKRCLKGRVPRQNFAFPIFSTIYLSVGIYFWTVGGQKLLLTLTIEQLIWSYLLYIGYRSFVKGKIEQNKEDSNEK